MWGLQTGLMWMSAAAQAAVGVEVGVQRTLLEPRQDAVVAGARVGLNRWTVEPRMTVALARDGDVPRHVATMVRVAEASQADAVFAMPFDREQGTVGVWATRGPRRPDGVGVWGTMRVLVGAEVRRSVRHVVGPAAVDDLASARATHWSSGGPVVGFVLDAHLGPAWDLRVTVADRVVMAPESVFYGDGLGQGWGPVHTPTLALSGHVRPGRLQ